MPDLSLNLPERSAIRRPTKHAITGERTKGSRLTLSLQMAGSLAGYTRRPDLLIKLHRESLLPHDEPSR